MALIKESSQFKSVMLTDAGSEEPLCPYHSWNTTRPYSYSITFNVIYSDRSLVPAMLTVWSYLTSWDIQNCLV